MTTRSLVRIALFAAIIAALGLLPKFDLPFAGGVPITAQTLGVMLAGVLLGPRQGAAAVLLVIFVVALGVPVLAGGRGGLGVFVGPTVGFLLGWLPGAYVTGWVFQGLPKRLPVGLSATAAAFIGGVIVIYAFGIVGLSLISGMSLTQSAIASLVFLPGDVVKAVATGIVTAATPAPVRAERAASPT